MFECPRTIIVSPTKKLSVVNKGATSTTMIGLSGVPFLLHENQEPTVDKIAVNRYQDTQHEYHPVTVTRG